MEIKFQISLSLLEGTKTLQSFTLPEDGKSFGLVGLTEKDLGRRIKIAAGAVNTLVDLGGVDEAKVFFIVSDQAISYKKNTTGGEAQNITVDRISTTDKKYGFAAGTTSGLTSLYFSNAGADAANVDIYVAY